MKKVIFIDYHSSSCFEKWIIIIVTLEKCVQKQMSQSGNFELTKTKYMKKYN